MTHCTCVGLSSMHSPLQSRLIAPQQRCFSITGTEGLMHCTALCRTDNKPLYVTPQGTVHRNPDRPLTTSAMQVLASGSASIALDYHCGHATPAVLQ